MHRPHGFSLIELLVTVAILGVLTAVAAPSFSTFILSQRIKTASFDVVASLTFARSEALKQNGSVTITPAGGNWASGWTVTGPDGATLRTQSAFPQMTITGPASLVYGRSGRATTTGNIAVDDSQSNASAVGRCIRIAATGIPRAQTGVCS